MRILCVLGKYNYGKSSRGEGIEYVNFVPAFVRLGHEVEVFDNTDRSLHDNFPALNKALLLKVEQFQPDIILAVQMLYEIWTETWDLIRKTGRTRIVNWATDDSWKYRQFSRFLAPHFDAFATTYPNKIAAYRQDGYAPVLLTQWAANGATLSGPIPASECKYSVSFVGSAYGQRGNFVRFLQRNGVDVQCFGHGWPAGTVASNAIPEIVRSSLISLNFSGSGIMFENLRPLKKQVKARVFEVPGMGGFLLTEWAPSLEMFYDLENEIDAFRDKKQLLERIQFYVANPAERDRRAFAAYERTRTQHTYDLRMKNLLDFVLERPWAFGQGSAGIDWQSFHYVLRAHNSTPTLQRARATLVSVCSKMFGEQRGPRAARRLVFEISWRLAGQRTYSSRGLPGRLFYGES